ncbi:protein zer-1 homolog [Argonauta hians]
MAFGWPPNIPDTLQEMCLNIFVKNPEALATITEGNRYTLRPGIFLSQEICEGLLKAWRERPEELTDDILYIFEDPTRTRLAKVNLSQTSVTNDGLAYIQKHTLSDLCLLSCSNIDPSRLLFEMLNTSGYSLRTLQLGFKDLHQKSYFSELKCQMSNCEKNVHNDKLTIFNCPNLQCLSLRKVSFKSCPLLLNSVLTPLNRLAFLDLYQCEMKPECFDFLSNVPKLLSLSLAQVYLPKDKIDKIIDSICKHVKGLRHLDLGMLDQRSRTNYQDPEKILSKIILGLPSLVSLDISGTNLAGEKAVTPESPRLGIRRPNTRLIEEEPEELNCSIPGLYGKTLDFLGLLNCANDACERENIPATLITGDANEEQILLSLQTYQDRSSHIIVALNSLYNLFRRSVVRNQADALDAILSCMKQHPKDWHVQISGSASLFYIVKGEQMAHAPRKLRKKAIDILLDAMENRDDEQTMLRNGFLTLCHFDIPHEVLYCYKRLVKILLGAVTPENQDHLVQRIGISLLNCLACQVDGTEKRMVGELGVICTMLSIVRRKLESKVCDETLEVSWSTMWNVTDETPSNCEKFMDGDGMELFIQCLKEFPEKPELLRNMMGLMGNISEVKYLRPRLMNQKYISKFSELLNSTSDGIEVSYNAAGVLSHIACDGAEAWNIDNPRRTDVLKTMVGVIESWDISAKRNINYRSFEPILRLVQAYDTPEAQHWAVWALCNLTRVYPERYCSLLEKESGVEILMALKADPRPYPRIKELASKVVCQITENKNKPSESKEGSASHVDSEMTSDEEDEEESGEEGEEEESEDSEIF